MKKRILLIWDYNREDLLQPFIRLSSEFEFVFLYYKNPPPNPRDSPFQIFYWTQFLSPKALLNEIRPDKIVFGEIETPYELALNSIARNRGIPTFLLAHGQRSVEILDIKLDLKYAASRAAKVFAAPQASKNRWHTLIFLVLSIPNISLRTWIHFGKYLIAKRNESYNNQAFLENRFEYRLPMMYIDFCKEYFPYYQKRDAVPDGRVHFIGNPFMDHIHRPALDSAPVMMIEGSYFLLIDTSLTGAIQLGNTTQEQYIEILNKLAHYCQMQNAKLVVKQHPRMYNNKDLPAHDNIIYVQDAAMHALITGARGCFGFVSTLLENAIVYKPMLLFSIKNFKNYQMQMVESGAAQILDLYTFKPEDITLHSFEPSPDGRAYVIDHYLFKADGRATERLAKILSE